MSSVLSLEKTIKAGTTAETAMALARDALIANGFRLVAMEARHLSATGPGMTSSHQNALRGFSRLELRAKGGHLLLEGDLSPAIRLGRFATLFPLALGGVLALTFLMLGNGGPWWVPLLATAPWLIIGPFMARDFRRRTVAAADALMESVLVAAASAGTGRG